MLQLIEPKTARLQLRCWEPGDKEPFAAMCADPAVMEVFSKTLSRSESDAVADRHDNHVRKHGWGFGAVELKDSKDFIGMVGLNVPSADLPFSPCTEILWGLAKPYWGCGYATDAAAAALKVSFDCLNLSEILSFTPVRNQRSRTVMERITMVNTGPTFDYPAVPASSRLKTHCLYCLTQSHWRSHTDV